MSRRPAGNSSQAWWAWQVTDRLAVELWLGDGPHIRLVAESYPIRVALADLGALARAIQDAVAALRQSPDVEAGVVIDLTPGDQAEVAIDRRNVVFDLTPDDQVGVVIDQDGAVIDLASAGQAGVVIDEAGVVIDQAEAVIDETGVLIDQDGVVIDSDDVLECDICGHRAIVVVDDSEHTTLCDECYDGYFREQPAWSVEEYLAHQRREAASSNDADG